MYSSLVHKFAMWNLCIVQQFKTEVIKCCEGVVAKIAIRHYLKFCLECVQTIYINLLYR